MRLVFKQIKVYAKLIVIVALAFLVAWVAVKNADHKVNVWFFRSYESINVLWLILFTSVGSIATWWILAATMGVWRDLKELHRVAELEKKEKERVRRERELAETEKRIDQKLKDALGEQNEKQSS